MPQVDLKPLTASRKSTAEYKPILWRYQQQRRRTMAGLRRLY
jgi:hypothetical protein